MFFLILGKIIILWHLVGRYYVDTIKLVKRNGRPKIVYTSKSRTLDLLDRIALERRFLGVPTTQEISLTWPLMFVVKKSLSASNFKANKWHVYTERDKMQWLNNGQCGLLISRIPSKCQTVWIQIRPDIFVPGLGPTGMVYMYQLAPLACEE